MKQMDTGFVCEPLRVKGDETGDKGANRFIAHKMFAINNC